MSGQYFQWRIQNLAKAGVGEVVVLFCLPSRLFLPFLPKLRRGGGGGGKGQVVIRDRLRNPQKEFVQFVK